MPKIIVTKILKNPTAIHPRLSPMFEELQANYKLYSPQLQHT